MSTENKLDPDSPQAVGSDFWQSLSPGKLYSNLKKTTKNANKIHEEKMSAVDKIALSITDKVGSFGFFMVIFVWTVVWCGYNVLASEIPALHWKSFDPFPAFVAYLLISNVIQILLMPLIMVGQNLQSRHAEIRSELDFETNIKAEREVEILLKHIEHNSELLTHLMRHLDCKLTIEEKKSIQEHREAIIKLTAPIEEGKA